MSYSYEEMVNMKIDQGEKLTVEEAISVLHRYHFDWRCKQALDVILNEITKIKGVKND